MRSAALALSFALLTACGPSDEAPAADQAADESAAQAPTLAVVAGNYALTAIIGTDTVQSTMVITADGAGSTLSLEGRPNIPLTVSMSGDSVVTQSAEYESVLRAGTMVTVRTAAVRGADGSSLNGNMVATYKTAEGEQEVSGTVVGRKVQ